MVKVLINYIREYLDSGMWKYEACTLSKEDLELIIKALEQSEKEKLVKEIADFVGGYNCTNSLELADKILERWGV